MKNKNIAIIGGAGFVGTRLANKLSHSEFEHTIFDIDQSNDSTSFLDVEDASSLKKLKGYDVIINLAAVHRDDVRPISRYDDVNVTGAKNICEAARQNNISTIVFTSSVAVYGFAPDNTDEEGAINYFNDYGRTKYLAEQHFRRWHTEDSANRTLVIIRPTVIFGEGNRGNVFNLLKQISTKRFAMVGPGKNKKSMAYVENVVAFIQHSMDLGKGAYTFNYIDKPDFNMNELVSLVNRFLHNKISIGLRIPVPLGFLIGYGADLFSLVFRISLPVSSIRVKKFVSSSLFDSSMETHGFVPPVTLKEGLEKTLRYEFIDDNKSKRTFISE
jgi:nucleoside-diphosphate-sugar epimerase